MIGGDARVRDLQVRVVESPTVSEVLLDCEYPAYMNRSPRTLPVTGSMQIPLGTKITVRARANKDLVRAQIDYPLDDNTLHTETISLPGADGDARSFRFELPSFGNEKTLAFTLFDTDGIHNRKPFWWPYRPSVMSRRSCRCSCADRYGHHTASSLADGRQNPRRLRRSHGAVSAHD